MFESSVACPHCGTKGIQTVIEVPFIRGMLLAHQFGDKTFVGCVDCVKWEVRKEVGRSLLYGWFSPTAIFMTVFYVPWNLARSFLVKPSPLAVRLLLERIGIPDQAGAAALEDVIYNVIAAMILADGKVDPAEVETAQRVGSYLVPSFDTARLTEKLSSASGMPSLEQMAPLLRIYLRQQDKELLLSVLIGIAKADGHFDKTELALLKKVSSAIGVQDSTFNDFMKSQ